MNGNLNKKYDIEGIPVFYGKFSDAIEKIREILKGFQHDLTVVQQEKGGVTTEVVVTITLRK